MTQILNTYAPQRSESVTRGFRLVTFAVRLALTIVATTASRASAQQDTAPELPSYARTVRSPPPERPRLGTIRFIVDAREEGSGRQVPVLHCDSIIDPAYRTPLGEFVVDYPCYRRSLDSKWDVPSNLQLRSIATGEVIVSLDSIEQRVAENCALEVLLPPCPCVRGRVIDHEGRPVVDADVFPAKYEGGLCSSRSPVLATVTDAEGEFSYGVDLEVPTQLCARGDGFSTGRSETFTLTTNHESPYLTIRLSRGIDRSGVVRSASGEPIAGVQVRVRTPADTFDPHVLTDDQGRFLLRNTPERCDIAAFTYGYRQQVVHAASEQGIDVVLEPVLIVRGTVRDRSGRPVAGITVRGSQPWGRCGNARTFDPDGTVARYGGHYALTDAEGRFELPYLSIVHKELVVERPVGDSRSIATSRHPIAFHSEDFTRDITLKESIP